LKLALTYTQGASALPTSGTAGTHVLLDLLSSNPSYIQRLRLEVEEVFAESTDPMDSCLLGKLSYIDSAIRESLRLNPVVAIEPRRKIVPPAGVTLPNGVHLPQNTWIGLSFLDVHLNEKNYPDAKEYRPFRFVEVNQECALKAGIEGKSVEGSDTVIVSTGSNFIAFGAGRHTW
jgi:cytochrome P450